LNIFHKSSKIFGRCPNTGETNGIVKVNKVPFIGMNGCVTQLLPTLNGYPENDSLDILGPIDVGMNIRISCQRCRELGSHGFTPRDAHNQQPSGKPIYFEPLAKA